MPHLPAQPDAPLDISVVLTTYNRAPLLRRALQALRSQQFGERDEVIVVDNGSTDTTADVLRQAQASFPVPLRHVREAAPGKTPALNTGLRIATGHLLALIDDDVIVAERWVTTIREIFREPSLALVGGRVDPVWECEPPSWLRVEEHGRYSSMSAPLALLHYGDAQPLGARTALGANMVVRRTILDALGEFSPALGRHRGTLMCGEDHEFCQRAVAAGYRCEYRPELCVGHWVPAARLRLSYFARWFFWLGITHAMLENVESPRCQDRRTRTQLPHLLRSAVAQSLSTVGYASVGRLAEGAERIVHVAFAVGQIAQRVGWHASIQSVPAAPLKEGMARPQIS